MEYLVRGRFVLTLSERFGSDGIIEDGAVYVSGKNIVEVGPYKDLKPQYPTAAIVGSPHFWVMPGFVNAHQHGKGLTNFQLGTRVKTAPLLYRGRANDVDTVIVDGEILYRGKKHLRLDSKDLFEEITASIVPAGVEDGKSFEAELLAYAIRSYEAWDDEPLAPHHVVNSV
ncbi:MAG TPA: hypothetical protein VGK77_03315 [Candidatus Binatia bacterium]